MSNRIGGYVYKALVLYCLQKELYCYIVSTKARLTELTTICKGSDSILLLPNSLPLDKLSSLKKSRLHRAGNLNPGARTIRFFTLSRLDYLKQIDWAIDAAAKVANTYFQYNIILNVCGFGPDEHRLRELAKAVETVSNLKIHFLGFVCSLGAIAAESDFFLFPSSVEGFPISLLEAALTGIPIVANNCPHGPKDMAALFSNIHLADPPIRSIFIEAVENIVTDSLNGNFRHSAPSAWPSSEELAISMVKYIRMNRC